MSPSTRCATWAGICWLAIFLAQVASQCPAGGEAGPSIGWTGTCTSRNISITGQTVITTGSVWKIACDFYLDDQLTIKTPVNETFKILVGGNVTMTPRGKLFFSNLKFHVRGSMVINAGAVLNGAGGGFTGGGADMGPACIVGAAFTGSSVDGRGANGGSHAFPGATGGGFPPNPNATATYDTHVNTTGIVHPGCGGGLYYSSGSNYIPGGDGGAALMLYASHITLAGMIFVNGLECTPGYSAGGGAGGGLVIQYETISLVNGYNIQAMGGAGGLNGVVQGGGGAGGVVYRSTNVNLVAMVDGGNRQGVAAHKGINAVLDSGVTVDTDSLPTCPTDSVTSFGQMTGTSGDDSASSSVSSSGDYYDSTTSTTTGSPGTGGGSASTTGSSSTTGAAATTGTTSTTAQTASSAATAAATGSSTTSSNSSSSTTTAAGSTTTTTVASTTADTRGEGGSSMQQAADIVNGGGVPAAPPFPAALVGGIIAAVVVVILLVVVAVVVKRRRGDGKKGDESELMPPSAMDSSRGGYDSKRTVVGTDSVTMTGTIVGLDTISSTSGSADKKADTPAREPTQRSSLNGILPAAALNEDTARGSLAPIDVPLEPTQRASLSEHERTQRSGLEATQRASLSGHENTQRGTLSGAEGTTRASLSGHETTQHSSLSGAPADMQRASFTGGEVTTRELLPSNAEPTVRGTLTAPVQPVINTANGAEATQRAALSGHEHTQRGPLPSGVGFTMTRSDSNLPLLSDEPTQRSQL